MSLKFLGPPSSSQYEDKAGEFKRRADRAVEWLKKSKKVNFVALYFNEPDTNTHAHGADTNKMNLRYLFKTALSRVDMALGHLVKKLNKTKLLNETNIIVIGKFCVI